MAEDKQRKQINEAIAAKWPELSGEKDLDGVTSREQLDKKLAEKLGITEQEARYQTQEFGLRIADDKLRDAFLGRKPAEAKPAAPPTATLHASTPAHK